MDFPAPRFSLLNSSDSQGSTPFDSLSSLPSEPPEIGKWFSSYVYESPELNSGEDLECGESVRLNVCEEGNDVKEETYKGKEENLRKSGKDDNLDPKGFVRCKNAIENDNFADQVSGSTDSFLLGSEPPNIKNWFSSYAYESPAIGSSDDINFSDYKEHIFDKEGSVTEKVTREKKDSNGSSRIGRNDDFADEQMVSGGYKKSKRSLETNDNEYAHQDQNGVDKEQASDTLNKVLFKSTAELLLNGKEAEDCHNKTSTKVVENSRVENHSTYNDELPPQRLFHQRNSTKEGSESKFQPNISLQREDNIISADDDDAMEKASRSNNKENDGNISAASRFISTRKSSSQRDHNENSLTNKGRDQSGRLQNDGHKNVIIQRKALSETTNFLRSDANEVTGKWRCPQKSKPNLGPPLKQLRLERWVRRL